MLDRAISAVVAAYHRFALPHCWGASGRLGADGTHWALYEDNLLSERHVRYGEYGGIGYYHVAGTYIARFSHFISCGALLHDGQPLSLACRLCVKWPKNAAIVVSPMTGLSAEGDAASIGMAWLHSIWQSRYRRP